MSPEGERCRTAPQDATVLSVEKTWEISGVTGTWKMTVVLDPEDTDPPPPAQRPEPDFEGLVEHFRTLIDLSDAHWRLDQLG